MVRIGILKDITARGKLKEVIDFVKDFRENGKKIIGRNSMIKDFENWYEKTYHKKVKVEYSTFGTNEVYSNVGEWTKFSYKTGLIKVGDTFNLTIESKLDNMNLLIDDLSISYIWSGGF